MRVLKSVAVDEHTLSMPYLAGGEFNVKGVMNDTK